MTRVVFESDEARLMEGAAELGVIRWHEREPGVVQVLELRVKDGERRRGHGSRLLTELVARRKPRKVWFAVGHKSQIIERAFLTKHGFHHVSTTGDLLKGEDLLIYLKSWV